MDQISVWDPNGNLVFHEKDEAKRLIAEEGWSAKDPLSKTQRALRKAQGVARIQKMEADLGISPVQGERIA